jgi:hypothetical protein
LSFSEADSYSSPSLGSGHNNNLFTAEDEDNYSGSVSSLDSCQIRPALEQQLSTAKDNKKGRATTKSWSSEGHFIDSLASDNSSTVERPGAAGKLKKYESLNKIYTGMQTNQNKFVISKEHEGIYFCFLILQNLRNNWRWKAKSVYIKSVQEPVGWGRETNFTWFGTFVQTMEHIFLPRELTVYYS